MRYLRKNTAVIITVGPFYDKTDGVTIETALTITNERITLTADTDDGAAPTNILDNITGAASGTANDLNYITNNDAGMMQLELAQADTNRVGRLFLSITDAANHVPVFHEFMILPANIYDSMILGTDLFDVSLAQVNGAAQTATLDTIKAETAAIVADTGTDGVLLTSAYDKAKDDVLTPLAVVDGNVDSILTDTGTTLDGKIDTIDTVVDGIVTDMADIDDILTPLAVVDGNVDDIKAKTDQLVFTVANQVDANALSGAGGLDAAGVRSAIGLASANLDTQLTAIDDAVDTEVAAIKTVVDNIHDTDLPAVKTETAAIKAKTDNLPSDPADESLLEAAIAEIEAGGGLDAAGVRAAVGLAAANLDTQLGAIDDVVDTEVAAIKAKTDQLVFTIANRVDASISGAGLITWPYTLTDQNDDPIFNALVWVSSDIDGANVLASGLTNTSGIVTFYLSAGTVYVWAAKSGYTFENPDTEVVS